MKSTACVFTMKPPGLAAIDITVNQVIPLPKASDQLVVCSRQNSIHIMTSLGQVFHVIAAFNADVFR